MGKQPSDVKSLRRICGEEIARNSQEFKENISRMEELSLSAENYHEAIKLTQLQAWDYTVKSGGKEQGIALWGNPELEGRILCKHFDINLHLINVTDDGEITHFLMTKGLENLLQVAEDNEEITHANVVHVVNFKNRHFILTSLH
ncbi:MAG: hypothetical protein K0S27_1785 [Gammaproteobacteria bacterium]|jgi:hypothetical protein|nr:hypothetical protein [Gammaproteobacteria bacterium]